MSPSLNGVRLKVGRARHHLDAVAALAHSYRSLQYQIVRKIDTDARTVRYVLEMPDPPPDIGPIIGDCIHNLRSALDHLVYQLVLVNRERPCTANLFPICNAPDMFVRALKRDRLCGVSAKAKVIIERLQPYPGSVNQPLWVLHELENIDKHRTLIVTGGVVADQRVTLRNPTTKAFAGTAQWFNAMIRNHQQIFGCNIGAGSPMEDVEAEPQGTALIAFEETITGKEVRLQLGELVDFVEQAVVPRFDPFF